MRIELLERANCVGSPPQTVSERRRHEEEERDGAAPVDEVLALMETQALTNSTAPVNGGDGTLCSCEAVSRVCGNEL